MVEAKHISGKNIFWSTLTVKSRGGKIFEFLHCPFEGQANMHHKLQPNWLTGRCCLAGGSKGQCRKSKIFLSLLLPMQVDQYIFFAFLGFFLQDKKVAQFFFFVAVPYEKTPLF